MTKTVGEMIFLVYYVRGRNKRPIDRHLPRRRGGADDAAGGDGLRQVAAARRGYRPSVSPSLSAALSRQSGINAGC